MVYLLSFIWSIGLAAVIFVHFQRNSSGREFVTLYLINFILQFLLLDLALQYVRGGRSPQGGYYIAMAVALSMVHVLFAWSLGKISSFSINSRLAFQSLLTAGYSFARYGILLWLAVRVYLYAKYGAQSFSYITLFDRDTRYGSPISYADTVLRMVALYLANGAAMALVVQIAVRGWRAISLFEWALLAVFFVFVLLGEAPLGVRRTVILYVLIFVLLFAMTRGISWRAVGVAVVLGVAGIAFMGYYQRIRFNAANPEVYRLLSSGNIYQILAGVVAYLTPHPQPDGTQVFRSGGLDFFATCLRAVDQTGKTMGGSLLLFSFHKVIPSAFYSGKSTLDVDDVVAQFFRLEERDYSSSILANLYVDFGVVGILLAPLLWWVTMCVALAILARTKKNGAFAVGLAGMIFGLLSMVESTLIHLFVYVRDMLLVLPIFYLVGLSIGRYKETMSAHDQQDKPQNMTPEESTVAIPLQSRRYPILLDNGGEGK
jgi:hypothetical protein